MSFKIKDGNSIVEGDFSQLEKLVENLGKDYHVDVGILGSETDSESGLTIAGIGAVHEFGTMQAGRGRNTTIPKRSFILMPLTSKQDEITKRVESRMQGHLEQGDVKAVFVDIGIAAEAVIQEAFETGGFGQWEPLSEITIERKGSSAPLIDEGVLRKSITSEVKG